MDNKKSKWPLVTTTVKYCGVKNVIFYLKYKNHIIKSCRCKYLVLPATFQHLFVRLYLVLMTPGKVSRHSYDFITASFIVITCPNELDCCNYYK